MTAREQFVDFLLEAKRATYAGQGDEATVTPLVPGSKQLDGPAAFSRDFLTYTNSSNGSLATFSGVEAISREGAQIYECRYAGGFLQ